jgi:FMN-dependent oxidoreductase (nitrilotriacetate monooxygenase family)
MTAPDSRRKAILLFCPEWNGMHPGAWRLGSSPTDGAMDIDVLTKLVQDAERAKFHGMFLADPTGFRLELSYPSLARTATAVRYDPFVLMSALAMVTDRIGLIMTAGTTYEEPYNIARRFASLDHLSHGRSGWNVVTVGNQTVAKHFGRAEHMDHDLRYERGAEFVDAVQGLWDTFADDAFSRDKASGINFDVNRMHEYKLKGSHLSVDGPLNVPRPVQGYPVIAQAGSSQSGRAFAARYAEVMFTLQANLEGARKFYSEMKAAAAAVGRDPDSIKILPALTLVVAETDEQAQARFDELDSLVDPAVGLELLSALIHTDLSDCDIDGPLPEVTETLLGTRTLQSFFVDKAKQDGLNIRQLISFMLRWGAVGGSPTTIADYIEEWVQTRGSDGFNVTFADMPDSMTLFIDQVIPILQDRGVFHRDYEGSSLRENLGLRRPENQFFGSATRSTDDAS